MIYEYVIFSDRDIFVSKGEVPCKPAYQIGKPIPYKVRGKPRSGTFLLPAQDGRLWNSTPTLAVAFTCRQMYLEAAPIWYANLRFAFVMLDHMKSFIKSIGVRNRDVIQHITIYIDPNSYQPTDDVFGATSQVLSAACQCLPGLRTIILSTHKFLRSNSPLVDPITQAAKVLAEKESHLECVTWLNVMRYKEADNMLLYLRDCEEFKREKRSQEISHVHRLVDMSPLIYVRRPHSKREVIL
jgi:hypothetical protein